MVSVDTTHGQQNLPGSEVTGNAALACGNDSVCRLAATMIPHALRRDGEHEVETPIRKAYRFVDKQGQGD